MNSLTHGQGRGGRGGWSAWPAPARPVLVEHGTEDISISWDGITHMPVPGTLVVTRNVLQSVSFFAARNGCVANGACRDEGGATGACRIGAGQSTQTC